MQKASYVSLQTALAFYNLIPEVVNVITSVSTGRPERLETPVGFYEFRHIKTELFFGYRLTDLGEQSAFVATPEKALLDLLYLQPGSGSRSYLRELRLQNTEKIDQELLKKQSEKIASPKIKNAVNEIIQIISAESEAFEDL